MAEGGKDFMHSLFGNAKTRAAKATASANKAAPSNKTPAAVPAAVPGPSGYSAAADENAWASSAAKKPKKASTSNSTEDLAKFSGHAAFVNMVNMAGTMSNGAKWDPLEAPDWDKVPYPQPVFMRIARDLKEFQRNPPPGVYVVPRHDDISIVDALIVGPEKTPYEGGFFHFVLRFPPDYPIHPPRVRLMTTGNNTVRFNPNLYKDGKVCLSLLGTWVGPQWSAVLGLTALLVSIQSLLNEKPYTNEPGCETEHKKGDIERYNQVVDHETIRVAVIEMVENVLSNLNRYPSCFNDAIVRRFHAGYDGYMKRASYFVKMNGWIMQDPFSSSRCAFRGKALVESLEKLRAEVNATRFRFLDDKKGDKAEIQCELPATLDESAKEREFLVDHLDDETDDDGGDFVDAESDEEEEEETVAAAAAEDEQ